MLAARLKELLLRTRLGRALYLLYRNLEHHNAPLAASGMAFDTFLSLVPLVAFAGLLLSFAHQRGDLVLGSIARAAPAPVARLVDAEYLRLTDAGVATMAPISFLAFLWVTSGGVSTALGVFEVMFETKPRPWYVRRAIGAACVLASIAVVAVVAFAVLGASTIFGDGALSAMLWVVPPLLVIGLLALFFRIAIQRPRPLRRVLAGVLVTTVLWAVVSAAFSYYVSTLARYATLYGSLAAVAIFLFWLWLLALALLVGGEITAQLDGIRSDDLPPSVRLIGPSTRTKVKLHG